MTQRLVQHASRLARRFLQRGPRPAILMYHRIAEEGFDPWGLAVSPQLFADHLDWIVANRKVVPLPAFAALHRQRALPADALALTFDDGYSCVAEIAAPILEAAGIPATIFISAELVERQEPFWWDELQRIVLSCERDQVILDSNVIPIGAERSEDNSWKPGRPPSTARQTSFLRIWAQLRSKRQSTIQRAIQELREQAPASREQSPRPMTPDMVRTTATPRIHFGSHALTHPWLSGLTAREQLREIGGSREACARLTGVLPTSFAYPYGDFNSDSVQAVAKAGYGCACATIPTTVGRKSDVLALPRLHVSNRSARWLERQLSIA